MSEINYTFFLFAKPSFMEGYGRLLDTSGSLNIYNESQTEGEADATALYADWKAIGIDIKKAMEKYESYATNK